MPHDFKKFPELTAGQMDIYYFESPHKQIFEDFTAKCVKVHDGDTITLRWSERDFDFPVRIINIAAPELKEDGGKESQSWLENMVLNENVYIGINPNNRIEKWGRLLGYVHLQGIDVGEQSMLMAHSVPWSERNGGQIPSISELIKPWA